MLSSIWSSNDVRRLPGAFGSGAGLHNVIGLQLQASAQLVANLSEREQAGSVNCSRRPWRMPLRISLLTDIIQSNIWYIALNNHINIYMWYIYVIYIVICVVQWGLLYKCHLGMQRLCKNASHSNVKVDDGPVFEWSGLTAGPGSSAKLGTCLNCVN